MKQGIKNEFEKVADDNVSNPLVTRDFGKEIKPDIYYTVDEAPPWYCCIILGFQHFLTALGGQISIPLILAHSLCMDNDLLGLSWIIGTYLMVGGVATCMQSTFGVR